MRCKYLLMQQLMVIANDQLISCTHCQLQVESSVITYIMQPDIQLLWHLFITESQYFIWLILCPKSLFFAADFNIGCSKAHMGCGLCLHLGHTFYLILNFTVIGGGMEYRLCQHVSSRPWPNLVSKFWAKQGLESNEQFASKMGCQI